MNKFLLISFYFFLLSPTLFAQGETDWWYFGDYAGIHFVDDTLEVVYDSEMITLYGNTTMSDENGNLLYYTNGNSVYNSEHTFMENGEDFDGHDFGTTAMSFRPNNNENEYFFVNRGYTNRDLSQYWYGYIDMDANDGMGKVSSHTFLRDSLMYYVTSTKKNNGIDYWIVFREPFGNTYVSYLLTEEGIDTLNPVYSQAGDVYMLDAPNTTRGNLLINPQGNLLAFILQNAEDEFDELFNGRLELFHFDSETGMVGERIVRLDESNAPFVSTNANSDSLFAGYGLAFSTDGEKLYYTQFSRLYQTNIAILDSASIQQSVVKYNDFVNPYHLTGMQLAKDGRLYISTLQNYLSVLHHPNIAGLDAGFEMLAVDLSPNHSRWDLPHFDPSLFSSGFSISNRCINTQTTFSLLYDMPYTYVYWDFGDGTSSSEWETSHTYSSTGTYTVNLTTVIGEDTTNKSMDVIIEGPPSISLGLDSSLFCGGDTLVLDAHYYASYYTWQDSSYQSTFEVTDEGKYYVQVKNICGQVSDTITYVLDRDNVHLGVDTMICLQEPLYLLADQPSATSWLWQDGSTLPYYEAETEGDYFVFVTTPCLFIMDSIYVYTEDCSLLAPNIITPNGDGKNDSFEVINLEMLDYQWSFEVFNRWGKQVYYTTDYQNDWQGNTLSDGVYFYILRSADTPTSYKGSVTIVRE